MDNDGGLDGNHGWKIEWKIRLKAQGFTFTTQGLKLYINYSRFVAHTIAHCWSSKWE